MVQERDDDREFVRFWNDTLVPKFLRYRRILVGGLTHHSARVFPSLALRPGDRILDVGCGFGDTTIELARRVGRDGWVVGIDCCGAFLDIARDDAETAGVENVEFVLGDAQDHPFSPDYDFCFSRFGTMFFENPVAGLRNMRRALKPGGRMTMLVWRELADNPWLALPREIVLEHLPPPGEDARTCGPGPFSMADEEMVAQQLAAAGYTDVAFERIDAPVLVGETPREAMSFQLALGPAGEVFREAGDEAERKRPEIEAALQEQLARYRSDDGIYLQSSSWMVTARNDQQ